MEQVGQVGGEVEAHGRSLARRRRCVASWPWPTPRSPTVENSAAPRRADPTPCPTTRGDRRGRVSRRGRPSSHAPPSDPAPTRRRRPRRAGRSPSASAGRDRGSRCCSARRCSWSRSSPRDRVVRRLDQPAPNRENAIRDTAVSYLHRRRRRRTPPARWTTRRAARQHRRCSPTTCSRPPSAGAPLTDVQVARSAEQRERGDHGADVTYRLGGEPVEPTPAPGRRRADVLEDRRRHGRR